MKGKRLFLFIVEFCVNLYISESLFIYTNL